METIETTTLKNYNFNSPQSAERREGGGVKGKEERNNVKEDRRVW